MAERDALQKRYAYQEMSNKVEQADRSQLVPRSKESDGVESLYGKKNIGRMGDKVSQKQNKRSVELTERMEAAAERKKRKTKDNVNHGNLGILGESGGQSILDISKLNGYQPTHSKSRLAFENMLNVLSNNDLLGSQSTSILRDAAEELLSILKNDSYKDPEKQSQIAYLLLGKANGLSQPIFHKLTALGKQIDDFNLQIQDDNDEHERERANQVNDEMGVAVIFDSDDENNDNDDDANSDQLDEVVDVDVLSNESDSDTNSEQENQDESYNNADQEEIILQHDTKDKNKNKKDKNTLTVHEIDAHWLQRQLSLHSDALQSKFKDINDDIDASTTAKIANDILTILEQTEDPRECENKLLVLLGFDLFSFIKILLKNRIRIWASVKMKRLESTDHEQLQKLKQQLYNESTGQGKFIWEELNFQGKAEDWTRERMEGMKEKSRLEAKKIAHTIDQNNMSSAIDNIGIQTLSKNSANTNIIPKEEAIELDLDSLKFRDGSHVMSSKTCQLPSNSWRAMKKGYEEVHVPAIRAVIPKGEVLVNINEMPTWTQKAFKGKYIYI